MSRLLYKTLGKLEIYDTCFFNGIRDDQIKFGKPLEVNISICKTHMFPCTIFRWQLLCSTIFSLYKIPNAMYISIHQLCTSCGDCMPAYFSLITLFYIKNVHFVTRYVINYIYNVWLYRIILYCIRLHGIFTNGRIIVKPRSDRRSTISV